MANAIQTTATECRDYADVYGDYVARPVDCCEDGDLLAWRCGGDFLTILSVSDVEAAAVNACQ